MIREMDANDLKSIFDFEREYFKSDAYSMETLEKFVSDKNILNLVYDCEEKLLGYINVSFYEDTANILKIAVAINSRRNGIGEELFKSALKILKEKQLGMVKKIIYKSLLKPKLLALLLPRRRTLHILLVHMVTIIPIIEYGNNIYTLSQLPVAKLPVIHFCILLAPSPALTVNIDESPPKSALQAAPARTILIGDKPFL